MTACTCVRVALSPDDIDHAGVWRRPQANSSCILRPMTKALSWAAGNIKQGKEDSNGGARRWGQGRGREGGVLFISSRILLVVCAQVGRRAGHVGFGKAVDRGLFLN